MFYRETGGHTNDETKELRQLQTLVKENVENTCRRVNQVTDIQDFVFYLKTLLVCSGVNFILD
mgnify:FL=1